MAELSVSDWQGEIARAKKYLASRSRIQNWGNAQNYYFNKYPKDVVSVNLIFAIGRALVPQLYFKTPTILVQPEKEEFADFAPVLEGADRQLITKMGMKQQLKLGILDAYLTNISVFKFGYHSVGTEFPTVEKRESLESEVLDSLESIVGTANANVVARNEQEMMKYSYHDWVLPDMPWMLRTRPQDFIVPWGTLDIASAPWCAFRIIRPLQDVLKDPIYTNKTGLKGNATLLDGDKGPAVKPTSPNLVGNQGKDGEELDAVEFWEVWDKRTGKIFVVHEDRDKFMRNEKHNLPIQGLPVEILQFNPTGWDFWGPSDVDQIIQQQIEYNETRTIEMNHKKTAITKLLYTDESIDQTELEKLMSPEQVAIKVNAGGGPISNAIHEMNPNMSPDLFRVSDIIRTDISEILGFSRNQAGEFDVSRRTATEAGIVQRALEIRSDERRDLVADLIATAFQRKINPIIFQQWTEERAIKVTGKEGWAKFTGPDIKGDYAVSVVADSVVPLTQAQKQKAAVDALTMFRGDPRIDQNRLYEWVLAQFQSLGLPPDLLLGEEEFKRAQQLQLIQSITGQGGAGNGNAQSQVPSVSA